MQFSKKNRENHGRYSIDDTERRIDQSPVDKLLLTQRGGKSFQHPSQKAVDKKQPNYLVSCILHLFSPLFFSAFLPDIFEIISALY